MTHQSVGHRNSEELHSLPETRPPGFMQVPIICRSKGAFSKLLPSQPVKTLTHARHPAHSVVNAFDRLLGFRQVLACTPPRIPVPQSRTKHRCCWSTCSSFAAASAPLRKEVSSSKLLQEKLSHYLDMVEIAIVRQISLRSDTFFKAMTSHDELDVSGECQFWNVLR